MAEVRASLQRELERLGGEVAPAILDQVAAQIWREYEMALEIVRANTLECCDRDAASGHVGNRSRG